ncbi:uncharacterized protein I206_105231 [Kwoniella pini CBS 10737]|uniref:Uncharacterized protein n=1 Tax=Kwoniella pini CBS 10737 TaxID=1296096 RepID=A0A1B9I4S8_9TREE|nr:uncharacterized protein I206_03860 [Kwoniella pini CBS 10737]OCF50535.1 hypothetical protein I206_03860 [Kwoniella pini CBS 10737]
MLMLNALNKRTRYASCRLLSFASASKSKIPAKVIRQNSTKSIIFESHKYNNESRKRNELTRPLKYHRRDTLVRQLLSKDISTRIYKNKHDPFELIARSPKSICIVTRQILPSSFLINLRPTYFPPDLRNSESTGSLKLLPDRILTRGRSKKGKGLWISCNSTIVKQLINGKGPHIGTLRQYPSITIPSNLKSIIQEQLLERILIELNTLFKKLQTLPRKVIPNESQNERAIHKPILRRLTKIEISKIGTSSTIDKSISTSNDRLSDSQIHGNIIALLDLSKLESNDTSLFNNTHHNLKIDNIPDIPLINVNIEKELGISVPIFEITSLFSNFNQRNKLLINLKKILSIERKLKKRFSNIDIDQIDSKKSLKVDSGNEKQLEFNKDKNIEHSSIIALYSYPIASTDDANLHKGDLGLPLFIALWRLRCFLGQGWEES